MAKKPEKKEKPKGIAGATKKAEETAGKEKDAPELTFKQRRAASTKLMLAAVKDKYGKGSIGQGSLERKACLRLSSGSYSLDQALGGGWARGRINLIWGDRSSSKTTLMLKAVGVAQKTDVITNKFIWEVEDPTPMVVQWIDAEGAFDENWARQNGVNCEELIYSKPDTAEQAADMVEAALASGAVDVVVVDSLAAMIPAAELDADMETSTIGVAARLNAKMFRKIQGRLNQAATGVDNLMPTVLFINQLRTKIGVMFGDPSVKPGGVAQDFFTSIETRTSASKFEYFDPDTKMLPKCGDFKFVVVKNKLSAPKKHGEFKMMLADHPDDPRLVAGTIDEVKGVMAAAEVLGIFRPGDAKTKTSWKIYDQEFKTKRELWEGYIQDPQKFMVLKRDLLDLLFPKQ